MQTLKQGFEEHYPSMASFADELSRLWQMRLKSECQELSQSQRDSIVCWLLGSDLERFENLNAKELEIAKQAMEYRYRILCQRYLGVSRERAYRNLMSRLASLATLRHKIQTWVSLSRDRQRSVMDVLQEVIQELLQSDTYMRQQMSCIAGLTEDARLRDALLFASTEEYCLRPVRNQPLLVYRFVNYLRRTQRGGLTQVPNSDIVRLVSEEILTDDSDNRVSLVDSQAIADYQEAQEQEEQQVQRNEVMEKFSDYLAQNLDADAVMWLRLHLQGKSQEAIAKELGKPIKEIYRLREKISYHAVRVFAIKNESHLVENWLGISLLDHNFGLTQARWEKLYAQITPKQQQILNLLKQGCNNEQIAEKLKMKPHQVVGEWTKIYLKAQEIRGQE